MKIAIDMMRVLYLVNVYQPLERKELERLFVTEVRTGKVLYNAIRRLQEEDYLSESEPFVCRPRGLAALQSVRLYKARDAGRLFHLKALAKSSTFTVDER